ncbi:hypothetical protein Tsubulata_024589, partial [Turnera subulata]
DIVFVFFVPPAPFSCATFQLLCSTCFNFFSHASASSAFPFYASLCSASIILLRSSSSPLSPSSSLLLLKTMTSTRGHHNRKDLSE